MAGWVAIGKSYGFVQYVDPTTVRKDGNFRRVWQVQDLEARTQNGELSHRALAEYDCKERRARYLSATSHSGPMASGQTIVSMNNPTPWHDVPPGTISEGNLQFVCAR